MVQSAGESHREDSRALAMLQLQSIVLNAEMKSDTSMKARFSLHLCQLDDIRPGRDIGITRSVHTLTSVMLRTSVDSVRCGCRIFLLICILLLLLLSAFI